MDERSFWRETNFSKWSLFLDRDGVINERLPDDYVKSPADWTWKNGSREAIAFLSTCFGNTFIVSNQQGVGKGLMSQDDLDLITTYFMNELRQAGVDIDGVYYCTDLATKPQNCRKPAPALAYRAKREFPGIDFMKSVMVGDMPSDILFGRDLGMHTVQISGSVDRIDEADDHCDSLLELANWIKN